MLPVPSSFPKTWRRASPAPSLFLYYIGNTKHRSNEYPKELQELILSGLFQTLFSLLIIHSRLSCQVLTPSRFLPLFEFSGLFYCSVIKVLFFLYAAAFRRFQLCLLPFGASASIILSKLSSFVNTFFHFFCFFLEKVSYQRFFVTFCLYKIRTSDSQMIETTNIFLNFLFLKRR